MKRNAIQKLIAWKESGVNTPVLLCGGKGVGKTYLALEFAKSFYDGNLYINFENNANIRNFIEETISSDKSEFNIIELLYQYFDIPEELIGTVLIILDEIHMCKKALILLSEYLSIKQNIPIVIISSYDVMVRSEIRNFHSISMYPMGFDEFLYALGQDWYAEVIKGHYQTNRRIPLIVHTELLTLFEDYLLVGGMPAAVNEYINSETTYNIPEVHNVLHNNFHKLCETVSSESEALKIKQVLNVLVEQLIKENKKFQYRLIRKGATYAMYKDAIEVLVNQGLILQCKKTSLLTLEEDNSTIDPLESVQFKLYANDVGILNSLIDKYFLKANMHEALIRKTLMENYIIQSLTANGYSPVFWESASQAKIDFVISTKDGLVPIETKINENQRSKSISVFKSLYEIPYSIKISSKNYEFVNGVKNIPYYAIFCL